VAGATAHHAAERAKRKSPCEGAAITLAAKLHANGVSH
jgi:hypothetical protein